MRNGGLNQILKRQTSRFPWRKIVFDIYFTEFGTALTIILPILFQYCYKYCYSDSRNLWAVMKAGGLALGILVCVPCGKCFFFNLGVWYLRHVSFVPCMVIKGNTKINELRTILQRESQNS
jgi:hypothetical protein